MRKPAKTLVVSVLSLALLPFAAYAEGSDEGATPEKRAEMTREERRAAWENLSDEEKQARREQMRAKWENMTPEEREAKRAEMRKRMESMTPEQREQMRKRMGQRGHRGGKRDGRKKEGA